MTWIKVTKEQFDAFVEAYPNKLTSDVSMICEPPQRTFYDFSDKKSNYMNSFVACEVMDWMGPDGEIDTENTGKFWTWAIWSNEERSKIEKRIESTCAKIGIKLSTQEIQ